MKTFKELLMIEESYKALYPGILLEYLNPDQLKTVEKEYTGLDKDHKKRTDRIFQAGSNELRFPVEDMDHDKSEVHKEVEKHLGGEISREDYIKGLTQDRFGRQVKIGRMIKDEKLRNRFSNDNTRAASKKNSQYTMSVHRGIQVFGQTNSKPSELHPNGHNWTSCKDVNARNVGRDYLPHEAKHSVVMFAHDHDGKEIYRATLHPHSNEHGTIYQVNSEYGVKHPSFQAHVHEIARQISDPHTAGNNPFYKIKSGVYNDNYDTRFAIHPDASHEEIIKHLNNANDEDAEEISHNLINHPNVSLEDKKKIMLRPGNENMMENRLPKALHDAAINRLTLESKNGDYKDHLRLSNFIENNKDNIKSEHLDKLIDHYASLPEHHEALDDDLHVSLLHSHKFNRTQINRILGGKKGDKNTILGEDLFSLNENLPKDLVENKAKELLQKKSLGHVNVNSFLNRQGKNIDSNTLESFINHPGAPDRVRRTAYNHINADLFKKLHGKYLKDKDYEKLSELSIGSRHNTPELHDKALNSMLDDYAKSKDENERNRINQHMFGLFNSGSVQDISKETVNKFMQQKMKGLYTGSGNHAAQFKNMSPKHIDYFIEHGNDMERHEISKRSDLLPRHVEALRNDKNDGIRDRMARRFGAPKREPEEPTYNKAEHWS